MHGAPTSRGSHPTGTHAEGMTQPTPPPSRHTRLGITMTEALVVTAVLLSVITLFAQVNVTSARAAVTAELSTYATDALQATAAAINDGNPAYATSRTLSATDLQLLASTGGRRQTLVPALTGQITPLASDPPRYRITLQGPDIHLTATATAPGGTP